MLKKISSIILTIIFVVALFSSTQSVQAASYQPGIYVTEKKDMNMRSSASLSSSVLRTIPLGVELTITEIQSSGSAFFGKTVYKSTGWVRIDGGFLKYLRPISEYGIEDAVFDYVYYSDRYPDLKEAFGYDAEALKNHWITCGIKEGRCASPIFDVAYYLTNNNDLVNAFGNNYEKAYNHFIQTGCNENRITSPEYHMLSYANRYQDLRDAFGSNYSKYFIHYMQYGKSEGRNPAYDETLNKPIVSSDMFQVLREKYKNGSIWNSSYNNKAWECHGFALTLGYELTSTDPYKWNKIYNLNSLKPGDIIRLGNPHTIMVTSVNGDEITFVDCNYVGKNKVRWDGKINRSKITSKFGPLTYVLVKP